VIRAGATGTLRRTCMPATPTSPGMGAAEPDFLVEIGVQL
jgi:hypothetical protein